MIAANPKLDALSETDRQILESWLVSFDLSWNETRLSDQIRELPSPGTPLRLPALLEMVKIDLERQWQHGHRPTVESYLTGYPEIGSPDNVPADLPYAEYEVRRQYGAANSIDDFVQRFPNQADELRRLAADTSANSASSNDVQVAFDTIKPAPSTVRDSQSSEAPKEISENFGRYKILKSLGKGGMGAVYLARDRQLDRDVALKVPYFKRDDDPDILRRFYREAQAAAALHHPNICSIHDVGEIDGVHFLTMAYIRGQSLTEVAKAQPLIPQERAAGIVRKVALALDQAHRLGVIHRDLKPSNIMLDRTGEPVIMDFGLARRLDNEDARLTKSGAILGTPAYMSPEQVEGDFEAIGPPSDIYSLGVILYELLTGRIPFQGSLASILVKIVNDSPTPPSTLRPGLDPRLDAICLKAMAKNPADRFASMESFGAALSEILDVRARPSLAVEKTLPRRRWPIGAAFAAAAVFLCMVIYVSTNRGTSEFESRNKDEVDGVTTLSPLAKLEIETDKNKSTPAIRKGPAASGDEAKERRPIGDVPAGQLQAFQGHNAAVTSLAFSADGKRVLSAAEDKSIRHWDLATGKELSDARFVAKEGTAEKFVLSSTGDRFLFQSMSAVILGDATTAKALKQINLATHPSPHKAFARNGRRVIVGAMGTFGEAFAWVWDLETDKTFRFSNHSKSENIRAVALSADGKRGLSVGQDGVRLWDVDPVKEHWHLNRPSVTALAFSPDGRYVVTGAMLGILLLHDAETGEEVGRFEGHTNSITSVIFSTESRRILSGSADKTVRLWDVAKRTELARFEGHTDAVRCVALSIDGRRAASGGKDGNVLLWNTAGSE